MRYILMSLIVLLTGCAKESLGIFHRGNEIVQRHHIAGDWDIPSSTHETLCVEAKMEWSVFWGKKVCPGELDKNASIGVTVAHVNSASYKDLVVPAVITGAFQFGGFVALAKLSPKVDIRQANYGSPIRTSTLLINAPVPGGVAH